MTLKLIYIFLSHKRIGISMLESRFGTIPVSRSKCSKDTVHVSCIHNIKQTLCYFDDNG